MSGEMIVNDTAGAKPRMAGYEFDLDASGLWLSPFARADENAWTVRLNSSGAYYYVIGSPVSGQWRTAKPEKPAAASPLWDAPETVVTEIIAYRGWCYMKRVEADGSVGVVLKSLHHDFAWDGPVASADEAPTAENQNGLYAIAGTAHHANNFARYVLGATIWGKVALSGTVVEGQYGYRAERATIQELWLQEDQIEEGDSAEGLCKALASRYQCDASVRGPEWEALR